MTLSRPLIMILTFVFLFSPSSRTQAETIDINKVSHVHGITANRADPSKLYMATHQGLFMASPDGTADRISITKADLMSIAAHPVRPFILYASGHPQEGGNLGLMRSEDGGMTWRRLSDGGDPVVDFHILKVSQKDPNVIYGADNFLRVSRDGGLNWNKVGPLPEKTFTLSVASHDAGTLYAATMGGLLISTDGGKQWQAAQTPRQPTTMVSTTPSGRIYAFIYRGGLIVKDGPEGAWEFVSKAFQDRYLTGLVEHPADPKRLYGLTGTGQTMISIDGGASWTNFEGHNLQTQEIVSAGKTVYEDTCQSCHGVNGIGERPADPTAKDEFGFVAPALNDDAHAWHHPDRQLVQTILNGSPRNKRMAAWKELLSEQDARYVVAYIKSLWNFRSLACQGARHMACMR